MRVEDLFKRLKREYLKVNLVQSGLDTAIFVLAANLIFFFAGLSTNLVYLVPAAALFFIADFMYRSRDYTVEIYEAENSELHEILRTARDNLDRRDEVSEALFDDLMSKARSISSESIIPGETVTKKVFLLGGLSILTAVSGLVVPLADVDVDAVYSSVPQLSDFGDDTGDYLGEGGDVMGDEADLEELGTSIDVDVEGEGESFEEGVSSEYNESELRFEASDSEIDEGEELAREFSLAVQELEN